MKWRYIFFPLLFILTAFDQFTKQYMYNASNAIEGYSIPVNDYIRWTYIENHGGVFGLLQGHIIWFTIISIILIILVIKSEYKNFMGYSSVVKVAIIFISAGAMGNMLDRILRGFVIDMIDVYSLWGYIFNVADMYIHIGIYLIIIDYLFVKKRGVK